MKLLINVNARAKVYTEIEPLIHKLLPSSKTYDYC